MELYRHHYYSEKNIQKTRRNGLPEKKIWLLFYEKNVNGKKCIILWNVDNPKISHVDSVIFSSALTDFDSEYGKIAKITTTQGKRNKYPWWTLNTPSQAK